MAFHQPRIHMSGRGTRGLRSGSESVHNFTKFYRNFFEDKRAGRVIYRCAWCVNMHFVAFTDSDVVRGPQSHSKSHKEWSEPPGLHRMWVARLGQTARLHRLLIWLILTRRGHPDPP